VLEEGVSSREDESCSVLSGSHF